MFKLKRDKLVRPTLKKKRRFRALFKQEIIAISCTYRLELPRNNYP